MGDRQACDLDVIKHNHGEDTPFRYNFETRYPSDCKFYCRNGPRLRRSGAHQERGVRAAHQVPAVPLRGVLPGAWNGPRPRLGELHDHAAVAEPLRPAEDDGDLR